MAPARSAALEPWRPDIPTTNPYQLELERFVACIRGTADPGLLDVDNALAALTLSIATQTSLSQRRPVEIVRAQNPRPAGPRRARN